MKKTHVGLILILALAMAGGGWAQEVEFNYNGRVKTQGQPFDGTGMFKFSLVSKTADLTFWANDGTSLDGSEPTTHVLVAVQNGFFSVDIGDTDLDGMASLDASLFNGDEKVYLRTWFNDGTHGFEVLSPDRKVANPALLGSQSFHEITLYVNTTSGDDRYSGLQSNKAKKTIQAAWDALPPLIRRDAIIYVYGGTYREDAWLTGKTLLDNATITITKDPASASDVLVSGADEPATTTIVRSGFTLVGQKNVAVSDIDFEYCGAAIKAEKGSTLVVSDCNMTDCGSYGLYVSEMSSAEATRLTIARAIWTWQWGVRVTRSSSARLDSCTISDYSTCGATVTYLSELYVKDTTATNAYSGFSAGALGYVNFISGTGNNHATNCTYGVRGTTNSVVDGANDYVVFSGCGTDTDAATGAVFYH
ncbi:right-handed parallel beta-helix repeat-containing protein [Candidatus Sumerlaeota bacterium]|nr:right-handed parallel beta-helix repeat-containing protein [Candidatus Sumerlaeota bacterium]